MKNQQDEDLIKMAMEMVLRNEDKEGEKEYEKHEDDSGRKARTPGTRGNYNDSLRSEFW